MTRRARAALQCFALAAVCASPLAAAPALAPPDHPASWVVEQFYARPTFPDLRDYITGEFAEHFADAGTMGARLPPGVAVTSRAVRQDDSTAAFATALRNRDHAEDWYTFLRLTDGRWKIAAVRKLVVPPIHYVLLDSMLARRAANILPDSMVPMLNRMALVVSSDSAIAAYLSAHRAELLALSRRFAALPRTEAVGVDGELAPAGSMAPEQLRSITTEMRALNIGALLRESEYPGCTFLKIGGSNDDHVGFIHAPAGCTPPAMAPDRFIYVEQVGPEWYVYKTT
jgi:hypothetical protein